MADLRIGRSWSEKELQERLRRLPERGLNFSDPVEELTLERGWHQYFSEAVVAFEPPGPPEPDGPFERGCTAVASYSFSDPRIVIGHFDPEVPLLGRYMLLEMRALRVVRYLAGVVIGATRSESADDRTVFGFRYETLNGHIEEGAEWFLLTKDHATGAIRFRIEAGWRAGQFPNWWSRLGFTWLGPYYQRKWHHRAHALLARLVRVPSPRTPRSRGSRLVHTDPEVIFQRTRALHV
jgi:uncharacterized protein (UPF0548 family)